MNTFFDKYRQKAEKEKEIPLAMSDWTDMENKLNGKSYKFIPFWYYTLPFIAGLILSPFIISFYKHSIQNNKSVVQNPTSLYLNTNNGKKIDTTYIEKLVYITKIETKYVTLNHHDVSNFSQKENELILKLLTKEKQLATAISEVKSLQHNIENQKAAIADLEHKSNQINSVHTTKQSLEQQSQHLDTTLKSSISQSDHLATALPEIPITVSLPLAADTLSGWQKFIHSMSIARIDLSAQAGTPFLLHPKLKNHLGYTFGAGVNLFNRSGVEIQANLAYTKMIYEGFIMDDRLSIPTIAGPAPDYAFTKAEVTRPTAQIDLSVYYHLMRNKRLIPKIGIGLGYAIPFSSTVSHDFIKSPVEYSIESKIKPKIRNPYSVQFLGKVTYKIDPRFSLNLYTALYQKLRKDDWLAARVDLSAGLSYRIY